MKQEINYVEKPNLEKSNVVFVLRMVLESIDTIWKKLVKICGAGVFARVPFIESLLSRPAFTNKFITTTVNTNIFIWKKKEKEIRDYMRVWLYAYWSQGKRGSWTAPFSSWLGKMMAVPMFSFSTSLSEIGIQLIKFGARRQILVFQISDFFNPHAHGPTLNFRNLIFPSIKFYHYYILVPAGIL